MPTPGAQVFGKQLETPRQKAEREAREAQARRGGMLPGDLTFGDMGSVLAGKGLPDVPGASMFDEAGRQLKALPFRAIRAPVDVNQFAAKNMYGWGNAIGGLFSELTAPQNVLAAERQARTPQATAAAPAPAQGTEPYSAGWSATAGRPGPVQPAASGNRLVSNPWSQNPSGGAIGAGQGSAAGNFAMSNGRPGGGAYDVVLGNGRFGSPDKPLSQMTMGEAYAFQRNVLIPNTKGRGIGVDSRGDLGSSASGAYQLTSENVQRYGQKLWGDNWRQVPFDANTQDAIGQKMFEATGGDPEKIMSTWAGFKKNPQLAVQAAQLPWHQAKELIKQVEGTATGDMSAGGGGGVSGGSVFNPGYYNQAIDAQLQAAQFANQPMNVQTPYVKPPEMAELVLPEKTDWTAADAALQDMRPEEILEADKQKTLNTQMWKGAAQAMMSLPEGAGLGSVLAALGGGLLGGKMTGNEEVDKKIEAFNAKMAAWKGAVYRNEGDKAKTLSNELATEANAINQRNYQIFNAALDEHNKLNTTVMTPQGMVVQRKVGDQIHSSFIPNAGANMAKAMENISSIYGNMGPTQNSVDSAERRMNATLAARTAAEQAKNGGDPMALLQMPQIAAYAASEQGRLPEVFGDQYPKAAGMYDTYLKNNPALVAATPQLADKFSKEYKEGQTGFLIDLAGHSAITGDIPGLRDRLFNVGTASTQTAIGQSAWRKATNPGSTGKYDARSMFDNPEDF